MAPESPIRSILLTTAFRDLSQRAAPMACALARAHGARIHVVHVLQSDTQVVPLPGGVSAAVPTEPSADAVAAAHAWLGRFVEHYIAPFHDNVLEAVIYATPIYRAICSYAREYRTDLIVMGTHAQSMLHRAFHGSISKAVLEHAPCPVLLVPCPRTPKASEPMLLEEAAATNTVAVAGT